MDKSEYTSRVKKSFCQQIYTMCTFFASVIAALAIHLYTQTRPVEGIEYCVFALIGIGECMIIDLGISAAIDSWRLDHPKPKNHKPKKSTAAVECICDGAVP